MVPDRQKLWTDGQRQNYITLTSSGDKNKAWISVLIEALGLTVLVSVQLYLAEVIQYDTDTLACKSAIYLVGN